MSVNSVNFGKIISVKAPYHIAKIIANDANEKTESEFNKQEKSIIKDTRQGKANAVYSFNSDNESYIFSGKEGKKFLDSYNSAYDIMDDAYINNRPDADIISDSDWERHAEYVKELIASAKKIPVMDVKYDKRGNVTSVNIIA